MNEEAKTSAEYENNKSNALDPTHGRLQSCILLSQQSHINLQDLIKQ